MSEYAAESVNSGVTSLCGAQGLRYKCQKDEGALHISMFKLINLGIHGFVFFLLNDFFLGFF